MKKLLGILVLGFILIGPSFADDESTLPPCEGEDHTQFINCYGSYVGKDYSEIYNIPGLTSDYTGEFGNSPGLSHGIGFYESYINGEYQGECTGKFIDDLMNGKGICNYSDGSKYVGEFKDEEFHGQGTYTYADGEQYVGEFKDGKLHGQGTMTWADGEQYVGEFKDDHMHGQGTLTLANGEQYVGEFIDGMKHGQGTLTYTNGDKYVGGFKDGYEHGNGTMTYREGDKYAVVFKNGQLIYETKKKLAAENNFSFLGFKFGQNIYETPTQGINWFNEESNMGISGPKLKLFGPEICTDFAQLNIEVLKLDDYDHYDEHLLNVNGEILSKLKYKWHEYFWDVDPDSYSVVGTKGLVSGNVLEDKNYKKFTKLMYYLCYDLQGIRIDINKSDPYASKIILNWLFSPPSIENFYDEWRKSEGVKYNWFRYISDYYYYFNLRYEFVGLKINYGNTVKSKNEFSYGTCAKARNYIVNNFIKDDFKINKKDKAVYTIKDEFLDPNNFFKFIYDGWIIEDNINVFNITCEYSIAFDHNVYENLKIDFLDKREFKTGINFDYFTQSKMFTKMFKLNRVKSDLNLGHFYNN